MKQILEFSTDDEDDADRFYCAVHGADFRHALWELFSSLRNHRKHGHTFKTADEVLDEYFQRLIDLTEGLNIE